MRQNKQPAAGPAEHESEFLKKNSVLINETARVYALANNASPAEITGIQNKWREALKTSADWRTVKNHFGLCVVRYGFEGMRLFQLVFDANAAKWNGSLAEAMKRKAVELEFRVDRFSAFAAEKLLDVYYEKVGEDKEPVGDLLSAMQKIERASDRDIQLLERWVEQSQRRHELRNNRGDRAAKTQEVIAGALAEAAEVEDEDVVEAEAETVDPRAEIEARIVAAEARKSQAVASEDFAAAKAAKDELVELQKELEALVVVATATTTLEPEVTTHVLETTATAADANGAAQAPVPEAVTATASAVPADDFLQAVQSSKKLSRKLKETIITRFAGGDETGARSVFATLNK